MDVLLWMNTCSIAIVGTSPINTRRRALAIAASTPIRSNTISSGVKLCIYTCMTAAIIVSIVQELGWLARSWYLDREVALELVEVQVVIETDRRSNIGIAKGLGESRSIGIDMNVLDTISYTIGSLFRPSLVLLARGLWLRIRHDNSHE